MSQRSFAGHGSPAINKMAPCGYRGRTANSRSKDDRKRNPQNVYRRSEGRLAKFAGVRQADSLYPAETGRRLYKEHCKSYQLALPQEGGLVIWERDDIGFTGQIYCCYHPDSAIIQWSVHWITLGLVTPPCIRFTGLYIHLLKRAKNGRALNNWIKSM